MYLEIMLALLLSYLLGAIPFGLILAQMRGIDLRHTGSGNIGATNVFRCVGKGWGVLTFALDMVKGAGATCMPWLVAMIFQSSFGEQLLLWRVLCGTIAVIGHLFPVYIGFRGGKGVSTSLGLLLGIAPGIGGIGLLVWVVAFVSSRYVSLASIIAAVAVGCGTWYLYATFPLWFKILFTALALLAILKHSGNIVRLCKGTENRFGFTKKQRAIILAKKGEQTK